MFLFLNLLQDEVICKVTIKLVEIRKDWNKDICSSCYLETKEDNGSKFCTHCDRIVPHALKRLYFYPTRVNKISADDHSTTNNFFHRFKITTVAADDTGGLEIVLKDREVMNLIKKGVNDLKPQVTPHT